MSRTAVLLGVVVLACVLPADALDLAEVKSRGALCVLAKSPRAGDEFFAQGADPHPGFDREVLKKARTESTNP